MEEVEEEAEEEAPPRRVVEVPMEPPGGLWFVELVLDVVGAVERGMERTCSFVQKAGNACPP